ncbi:hypothetical protein QLS91_12995 [Flavobacterium sp. LB2P84]|uniref:hypothetical protein n=1 Tax=Flavobacterium yafengii TaxID=3041253 RepID=UPI0024A9EAC3|nr:hypothetical protein [Flavobacterium yafengii]MDI6033991.1 hypothetical protein [Flavobacterium yafengii]
MKHQLYNELNGKGEVIRPVSITEELAETLNGQSESSGLSYELAGESAKDKPASIKIGELEFEKKEVIEALLLVDVKLTGNTGIAKTQETYDALSDENKVIVQEELNK